MTNRKKRHECLKFERRGGGTKKSRTKKIEKKKIIMMMKRERKKAQTSIAGFIFRMGLLDQLDFLAKHQAKQVHCGSFFSSFASVSRD